MEAILFIKELNKRGALYSNTWMSLLIQYNGGQKQSIRLIANPDVPKSTYSRIISLGIELFPKFISTAKITKNRNEIVIEVVSVKSKKIIPVKEEIEVTEVVEVVKKEPKQPKVKPIDNSELIKEIIDYLNECTGKNYKAESKIAQSNINARLKEGYTLEDFKKVIFVKTTKWLGSKMEDYLTPNTLFGNKFESYRNENITVEKTQQQNAYEQVIKATELGFNS